MDELELCQDLKSIDFTNDEVEAILDFFRRHTSLTLGRVHITRIGTSYDLKLMNAEGQLV